PQRVTVGARDGLSLLMPTFEERQLIADVFEGGSQCPMLCHIVTRSRQLLPKWALKAHLVSSVAKISQATRCAFLRRSVAEQRDETCAVSGRVGQKQDTLILAASFRPPLLERPS